LKLKILILFVICFAEIFSQRNNDNSSQFSNQIKLPVYPCIPSVKTGTNNIDYDNSSHSYGFYYDNVKLYEYDANSGGSFMGLKVFTSNSSFNPSTWGGISAILSDSEITSGSNTQYECLSKSPDISADGKSMYVHWRMKYKGDELLYSYKFQIAGRTLIIEVECDSADANKAFRLDLSRCSNAINAVQVGIPYLTLFNVLFANNVFTSFFIDWELTNASELKPQSHDWDSSSVHYAMDALYNLKTNHTRNRLKETLYLTSSPDLEDVLPSIPNPVSAYKLESANRIIWDYREPFGRLAGKGFEHMQQMYNAGIRNIWLLIHDWQRRHTLNSDKYKGGYDDGLPNVLPSNDTWEKGAEYGGNKMLDSVINLAKTYGYRVGLHENYYDYYDNAENDNSKYGFHFEDAVKPQYKSPAGTYKRNYKNIFDRESYILKPSRAADYVSYWSSQIEKYLPVNSCYLDVHSSANPSDAVDYDGSVPNAGYFRQTLNYYRGLYPVLRKIYHGPVIGEGGSHFFYQGYLDDIEARIYCARLKSNSPITSYNPCEIPLLVNFDLLKLHPKAFVHGVGFYPFFFGDIGNPPHSKYDILCYIATELAYGHGGYLPDAWMSWNFTEHASIEQKHVFPIQQLLPDAIVQSIMYNDNGQLKNVSDYIRSHPKTFHDSTSTDFMGQVMITYNNGIVICVNRNPSKEWKITLGVAGNRCWFDYNGSSGMDTGYSQGEKEFMLSAHNGWACYVPAVLIKK